MLSKRTPEETRKFLALARERFIAASEAEGPVRTKSLNDLKFYDGDQWPDDIKNRRNKDNRPCLTNNLMPKFVRQVTNEQIQQDTGILITAVGDGADVETADILQGMIRHIEANSEAEIVYSTAFKGMVIKGFDYWRVITDYVDDGGDKDELDTGVFDQEIKIQRIKNPFTVYFDPSCTQPDYSDANYAFIIEDLAPEDFKLKYKNSDAASLNEFSSIGDSAPGWATKESIRVAEYFYIDRKSKTIYLLEDGTVTEELPKGQEAVKTRQLSMRKVMWAKITGTEILEEREWAGKWIPIVPVLGEDMDIDGKRSLKGLVRDAIDPQRQKNFMESAATEAIALAPKAPFIAAAGQVDAYKTMWESANTASYSVLPYDPIATDGKTPLPPPQRNAVEPPIQAMSAMIQRADENLKSIIGLYDPSLGVARSDQSGKAIQSLQKQGDVGTLNYSNNLQRSKRHTGRIILDLIPKIYDTQRIQRIVNPDGTSKLVTITNSQAQQAQGNPAREMLTQ
jgi:hypothetical protein